MNILKAIKNVKSRNLIIIHVDRILDMKPTKLELTTNLIETNYRVINNPLDVKLIIGTEEFFIKDIQRINTSVHFEEVRSMNAEIMRVPMHRICEIYLIKPLTVEEGTNIMSSLKQ